MAKVLAAPRAHVNRPEGARPAGRQRAFVEQVTIAGLLRVATTTNNQE
jgi:hypothetical protein